MIFIFIFKFLLVKLLYLFCVCVFSTVLWGKKKIVGLQNLMARNRQLLECGSASPEGRFSLPFLLVQVYIFVQSICLFCFNK